MSNPFNDKYSDINLTDYIWNIFIKKKLGDSFEMDTLGRDHKSFRALLFTSLKRRDPDIRIRTKTNKDGEFWVKILKKSDF